MTIATIYLAEKGDKPVFQLTTEGWLTFGESDPVLDAAFPLEPSPRPYGSDQIWDFMAELDRQGRKPRVEWTPKPPSQLPVGVVN